MICLSLIFLRHTNDSCLDVCTFSADTRQENEEPEDTTLEEESHDGHVSLLSLFSNLFTRAFADLEALLNNKSLCFCMLLFEFLYVFLEWVHLIFQEELHDNHESMQEMDILDMNILDETENDNGLPAEDDGDDNENFHCDEDELLNEEHDAFEPDDEVGGPEVRNYTVNLSSNAIC